MKLNNLEKKIILNAVNDLINDKTLLNKTILDEVSSLLLEIRKFVDDLVVYLYNEKINGYFVPETRIKVFSIINKYAKELSKKYDGE